MGLSSSQARLLSLTSRMHDIEYKAQKLEAQKLQMANESNYVYKEYEDALNATKIQTRIFNLSGGDTFMDASLAVLENGAIPTYKDGEVATKTLFLQEISTGRLMITPEYADYIGVNTDSQTANINSLEEYLESENIEKTKVVGTSGDVTADTTKITSFNAIANSTLTTPQTIYSGFDNYVENTTTSSSVSFLDSYACFDSTHDDSISTVTDVASIANSVASFEVGKTYEIAGVDDLKALESLCASGVSTAGVTFVLTDDIEMASISNWDGIDNFEGTFNGNGYEIKNLTGTQGLFASTDGATIENLSIVIGSAGVSSSDYNDDNIGGLIGVAKDTIVDNIKISGGSVDGPNNVGGIIGRYEQSAGVETYIGNISSSVNVSGNGCIGGIIGVYDDCSGGSSSIFENIYSTGEIDGYNNIAGGIIGLMGTGNSYNKSFNNIYSGGSVSGAYASGFICYLQCSGDDTELSFNDVDVASQLNFASLSGVFIAEVESYDAPINISLNGCQNDKDIHTGIFNIGYYDDNCVSVAGTSIDLNTSTSTPTTTTTIPSIKSDGSGSFYSNIMGVLIKSGFYDPINATESEKLNMEDSVKEYLLTFANNDADNSKLYYLNEQICDYLSAETPTSSQEEFAEHLYEDVLARTPSFSTEGVISDIERSTEDKSWNVESTSSKGMLTIPHSNVIKKELTYALMINDETLTEEAATQLSEDFIKLYDTNDNTDKAYLASVNEILYNYSNTKTTTSDFTSLMGKVNNGEKWEKTLAAIDNIDNYNINMNPTDESGTIIAQTETIPGEDNRTDILDWDWESTEVINAVNRYNVLKHILETGFIIIGDAVKSVDYESKDIHKSSSWLTNIINAGIAQFAVFDSITSEFINTSVATETSLQEISNEAFLKMAESEYEAAMRKINKKDQKYDTELAALDAERSAIKTEQETLKSIAKDNVDRTFKLFS